MGRDVHAEGARATLLTLTEYEKYKRLILPTDLFWIKSKNMDNPLKAYCLDLSMKKPVPIEKSISSLRGVRPLIIAKPAQRLHLSDVMILQDNEKHYVHFTVLEERNGWFLLLSDEIVTYCMFDNNTNEWNKTFLKKFLSSHYDKD